MVVFIGPDTTSQITSNHLEKADFNVRDYKYGIQNRALLETISGRNMKLLYHIDYFCKVI